MSFNLVPVNAAYTATSWGSALSAGTASGPSPLPTSGPFTIECRFKGFSGSNEVVFGQAGVFYLGIISGTLRLTFGNPDNNVTLVYGPSTDWRHFEWNYDPSTGSKFFIDGILVNSSNASFGNPPYSNALEVRTFASAFTYSGQVDELAFYNTVQHTAAFTLRTGAIDPSAAGLIALYKFDGTTNNNVTGSVSLPGAPTIGTATAGVATASVTFTTGAAGTNPTTSYIATASSGETATGTGSPIAFGTLSTNVARTIHVQAISVDGKGPASAESNSVTPTASSDTTPPVLTGVVTLGTPGATSVAASWPAGSDNIAVAGYERSIDGGTSYVSVGNVTSATLTGLARGTAYPPVRVRAFDAAGNKSTPYIASAAGFTAATSAAFTDSILFSPGNWNVQSNRATTINAGAYFKTIFTGASCVLNFDTSALLAPFPQLYYRVDGRGPSTQLVLAATVNIAIPSEDAIWGSKGGHILEVWVKATTSTQNRFDGVSAAAALTGITLESGKVLSLFPKLPLSLYFFGDSITQGAAAVNLTSADMDTSDATVSWIVEVARRLGAEYGNIGFGGTGWVKSGDASMPNFVGSFNQQYNGSPRTFLPAPDAIIINLGTNDNTGISTTVTGVLNAILNLTPSTTKLIILRPFNGKNAAEIQSGVAASNVPSRCTFVDTTGFFNASNSADGLHPLGIENLSHIGPSVAAAVAPVLAGATATLVPRTVSVTLGTDANTPAANLTGLKVSYFDEATPDLHTIARYKTASGTTNASGVLTFTAQSTLAAGATGYLVVQGAGGVHYNAPVVVA
ncbi:MAG: hypothetical protein M3Y65_21755 [Pseudomonadota bacterium]|nr:hypothetical protein [Pseudomonadota bacterium]